MREIYTRVMFNEDEGGLACGPVAGVVACDAEMAVEDDYGKTIYLHAQWIDEAPGIRFEATPESIYDIYGQLNKCDFRDNEKFSALIDDRDRIEEKAIKDDERFQQYYEDLEKIVIQTVKQNGYLEDEE